MTPQYPLLARLPVWIIGLALLTATLLPFIDTNEWWIRIFDFPRLQIALLLGGVTIVALLLLDRGKWGVRLFLSALLLALGYQAYRIFPYTPLAPVQALAARDCDDESSVRLLIANVLASNRQSQPLLDSVRETDPDILLAVETDIWWDRQLSVLEAEYPFILRQPQDDTYGMHLFSKLELVVPEVNFLLEHYVPSIETGIRLRSGALIDFHGVHPKPPQVAQDTDQRDAELLIVGKDVSEEREPAIVAGDMNDVAWSQTTTLFQEISGLLDPRIGRGPFSTYNANWPFFRWPLDHVFFEESFLVMELERMDYIGSDHFPIFIALCHKPGAAAARQDEPDAGPEDREQAEEAIEEGRQEAR